MRSQVGSARRRLRFLLPSLALLGSLLLPCASAWAKTQPGLALITEAPLGAGYPSFDLITARQSPGGAELISITSATPSICEVGEEVFGANEEPPLGREVMAEVEYLQPGLCTFGARVQATSTTEAAETSESVEVPPAVGGHGAPVVSPAPFRTRPELAFEPPTGAYPGSARETAASASRPGLRVVSTTPAVCTIARPQVGREVMAPTTVQLNFLVTGTCSLTASLPKSAEHEALEVTKSIAVVTASFTSSPPSDAALGGSYVVSATSVPGLAVDLGAEGACSFTKPDLEKHLPEEGSEVVHVVVEAPRPTTSPATVYFVRTGGCKITAGGEKESERVSLSFPVAPGRPEQLTFTSPAPTGSAVVGDSYSPTVNSSEGLEVTFSIATPSVCTIVTGQRGGQHVSLIGVGTCTIDVREEYSRPGEGPEAGQSFAVTEAMPERHAQKPESALKACNKDKSKSDREKCEAERQNPPWLCLSGAPNCGTLHVHVYALGGSKRYGSTPHEERRWNLRIVTKLANGEVQSFTTPKHNLELTAGTYKVGAIGKKSISVEVTVSAGQAQEIKLTTTLE